jgi:alkylhydroperoxidase/carboxymuconolactone decarboxylase family protein YurZ
MTACAAEVSLEEIRDEALTLLRDVAEGEPLDEPTEALIGLSVRVCATALDMEGTRIYAERALDAGATPNQVHDVLVLVSAMGVHTLKEGSRRIAQVLRARGELDARAPLDGERARLWERYVGRHSYWVRLEQQVPGFLDALVRLAPEAFEAFFQYCAVPWRSGALPSVTKELICMAVDATPTHRYLPGMRVHLVNALELGAGRAAALQALDIAADAPPHRGLR